MKNMSRECQKKDVKRNGRKQRNKEEKTKRHRPTCAGSQANQGKGSSGGLALLRESVWLWQTPVLSFVLFSFLTRLSVHGGGVCSIWSAFHQRVSMLRKGHNVTRGCMKIIILFSIPYRFKKVPGHRVRNNPRQHRKVFWSLPPQRDTLGRGLGTAFFHILILRCKYPFPSLTWLTFCVMRDGERLGGIGWAVFGVQLFTLSTTTIIVCFPDGRWTATVGILRKDQSSPRARARGKNEMYGPI